MNNELFFALIMEAVRISESSVYSNETTRRYMTQGSSLHTRRREILKSHKNYTVHFDFQLPSQFDLRFLVNG
jgi:hypothetical protein